MHYIHVAVLDASIDHGRELGRYHSIDREIHSTYTHDRQVYCISTWKESVLYMHHSAMYSTVDYVIQENVWCSSSSISQRMKQAISKVFIGDVSKSIYIVTNYHASDELNRGPEFFIIMTQVMSSLPNNHKKVNCNWGCNYISSRHFYTSEYSVHVLFNILNCFNVRYLPPKLGNAQTSLLILCMPIFRKSIWDKQNMYLHSNRKQT